MLLAAALSILALVSSRAAVDFAEAAGPPGFDLPTLPQEVLGLVLTLGPLAFRRRAPIAAVLTCASGFVVSRTLLDAQEASVVGVGISIAIYSAAAYGRPPSRNWACGVAGWRPVAGYRRRHARRVARDRRRSRTGVPRRAQPAATARASTPPEVRLGFHGCMSRSALRIARVAGDRLRVMK